MGAGGPDGGVAPRGGARWTREGFTAADLRRSGLAAGVLGLLVNHNNMLLTRSTAEWGRGDWPL